MQRKTSNARSTQLPAGESNGVVRVRVREQLDASDWILVGESIRANAAAKVGQEVAVKGGH